MDDDVTLRDLFGSDEEEETVPAPPSFLTWLPDDVVDRIFQLVLRHHYTANQVCRRLIWLYHTLFLDAEDGGGDRLWRYGLLRFGYNQPVAAPATYRLRWQALRACVQRFNSRHQQFFDRLVLQNDLARSEQASLLHFASEDGMSIMVRLLLHLGVPVDARRASSHFSQRMVTPLWSAALHGHQHSMRCLLEAKANPNSCQEGRNKEPLLTAACLSIHPHIVDVLLEHGADVELRDEDGRSALASICTSFRERCANAQRLLNAGADINAADVLRQTPLMHACYQQHEGLVKLLLDNKADVTCRSVKNQSAYTYAVKPYATAMSFSGASFSARRRGVIKMLVEANTPVS